MNNIFNIEYFRFSFFFFSLKLPVKLPKCSKCSEVVFDKFVLKVEDTFYHMRCLRCAECDARLADKCFSRDGLVYCREDFFR